MNIAYSAADYAAVRRYVDPVMTPEVLPDYTISDAAYLGTAERWVYSVIPNADDATGGDLTAIKRAILIRTAAILLSTSPVIRMGRMAEQNFQIENGDTARRIEELKALSLDILRTVSIRNAKRPRTMTVFAKALARERTW